MTEQNTNFQTINGNNIQIIPKKIKVKFL